MPYHDYFGGVFALTEEQMLKINGFSNLFFGWGGEGDEIRMRVLFSGQKVQRYPVDIGKYCMLGHSRDKGNEVNPQRLALMKNAHEVWRKDGLNSLNYTTTKEEKFAYYTKLLVDIAEMSSTSTDNVLYANIKVTTTFKDVINKTTSYLSSKLLKNKRF